MVAPTLVIGVHPGAALMFEVSEFNNATSYSETTFHAPEAGPSTSQRLNFEELREHVSVVRRRLEAGQYLYRAGQPFRALFLVHAGSVKTCELAEDGREQVTGFRMAGELVGVESIGVPAYTCDVVALE